MIRLPTGLSWSRTGKRVTGPTPFTCWASATTAPMTTGRRKASMTNRVSHTSVFLVVGSSRTTAVGEGPNIRPGASGSPGAAPTWGREGNGGTDGGGGAAGRGAAGRSAGGRGAAGRGAGG